MNIFIHTVNGYELRMLMEPNKRYTYYWYIVCVILIPMFVIFAAFVIFLPDSFLYKKDDKHNVIIKSAPNPDSQSTQNHENEKIFSLDVTYNPYRNVFIPNWVESSRQGRA